MAPHKLTPVLQSLPPILYMYDLVPILSCSKAPWGLSVLSRVTSIFTGTSISPGVLLRQCPNRYAFRAGQNLPDEEFRYLRTVIVTAAVYRGLSSPLRGSFLRLLSLASECSAPASQVITCEAGAVHSGVLCKRCLRKSHE